ncbi:MAG: hypothetical protein WAK60_06115 [Sedimentisphaerales bacterium]
MKKTHLIFIGCLLVAALLSLSVLKMVLRGRESQGGAAQRPLAHHRHITNSDARVSGNPNGYDERNNSIPETKSDVLVSDNNPDRHNNGTAKTPDSRPDTSLSKPKPAAYANPVSKTDSGPSGDLSGPDNRGNVQIGRGDRSVVPAKTIDEPESDRADSDGLYDNNPEVHGQNGEILPFPEEVLARKAQDILRYHGDRKADADIIEEDGLAHTEASDETAPEVSKAEKLTPDEAIDHDLQVKQLLAKLAEGNPTDVRLQAIYLLEDAAPKMVAKFLNDKDDVIRSEAERFAGILPKE